MGSRVIILGAGVGSGHNMAAQVLEDAFHADPSVSVVQRADVLDSTNKLYRKLYDDAYFGLVADVPWLVEWGYDNNDAPFKLSRVVRSWDRINTTSAVKAVKEFEPDIVVCTHFLPARLVTLMLARESIKARLAIVTTDYDFQGLWLTSSFNDFFVARDETRAHMAAIGVPADRIAVSGIPVRPMLGQPVDAARVRTRFGLREDLPTVLISAGAAGGSYTKAIVQQTLQIRTPFQAVIVCGRNAALRSEITRLVGDRRDQFKVLGYTTEMADLMRIASVFVGKPGGLSSSECMAAGLPMVLINPIPGQEERNSDFLLEEGAAARCNYTTTVGYKIEMLLSDPDRLARMSQAASGLGFPDAGRRIASTVLGGTTPPLWISRAAQRSILTAAEQGLAAQELPQDRRLRTFIDSATGRSLAVITQEQAAMLRETAPTSVSRFSSRQISEWVRGLADPDEWRRRKAEAEEWRRRRAAPDEWSRRRTEDDLMLTMRRLDRSEHGDEVALGLA